MSDRDRTPLAAMTEPQLEFALRDIGSALDVPARLDLAPAVGIRIRALPARPSPRTWWFGGRPVRRGLVLAFAILALLAAIVGAAVLGVPGIRLILVPGSAPSATASPSRPTSSAAPTLPGQGLGLGTPIDFDAAADLAGFAPRLPTDPAIGPPDAVYLRDNRLSFVWAPRPGLPATEDPTVGLLLSEFRGEVDPGWYDKLIHEATSVEPVEVAGASGYWIQGAPHFIFYVDPSGRPLEETRRTVGDVLIWADEGVTYRVETAAGRERAMEIAARLR
jgi:hypothetical protein